jgi:hypothetical protein
MSPTQRQVGGLLSPSPIEDMTTKCGLVVFFSCRKRRWALAYHFLLMFCPLLADDDDEPKAHCHHFF